MFRFDVDGRWAEPKPHDAGWMLRVDELRDFPGVPVNEKAEAYYTGHDFEEFLVKTAREGLMPTADDVTASGTTDWAAMYEKATDLDSVVPLVPAHRLPDVQLMDILGKLHLVLQFRLPTIFGWGAFVANQLFPRCLGGSAHEVHYHHPGVS